MPHPFAFYVIFISTLACRNFSIPRIHFLPHLYPNSYVISSITFCSDISLLKVLCLSYHFNHTPTQYKSQWITAMYSLCPRSKDHSSIFNLPAQMVGINIPRSWTGGTTVSLSHNFLWKTSKWQIWNSFTLIRRLLATTSLTE